MAEHELTEREEEVLQAVIRSYVELAEPAGSRTVARRFMLGISAATVRNTMADLEEKGFLYHPHTSAGRIPTDLAYRYYVDTLMQPVRLTRIERERLRQKLVELDPSAALDRLLRRSAQALGILSGELGVAVAPRLEEAILEKLELIAVTEGKVLLVLSLRSGRIRTVYIDVPVSVPPEALAGVTAIMNERLAGQTLKQIRETLPERLRDSAPSDGTGASDLLNIFVQSGEELFELDQPADEGVHLGRTSVLASQPEFASGSQLKSLIELTESRELLGRVLRERQGPAPLQISIGREHEHQELAGFTLVTSEYASGNVSGVIGVIGPTRMPYDRVVSVVQVASRLMSELLGGPAGS